MIISEGVEGYYFYHISPDDSPTKSLCGKTVMPTQIPVSTWGFKGHLNERYCAECEKLAMFKEGA